MKRAYFLVLLIALLCFPHLALSATWTVMVYLDADNDLGPYGIFNMLQMERVGSGGPLNILVQFDGPPGSVYPQDLYDIMHPTAAGAVPWRWDWEGTRRFWVGYNPNAGSIGQILDFVNYSDFVEPTSPAVMDLGEVNMGDPKSLEDFVVWGMQTCPANYYLLFVWDHGTGWKSTRGRAPRGVCWDITSQMDYLTEPELRAALANVYKRTKQKINVLCFDACLMSMVEIGYDLKDYADMMIASEQTIPAFGMPYDQILDFIRKKGYEKIEDEAKDHVSLYDQFYTTLYGGQPMGASVCLAASDLNKLEYLEGAEKKGVAVALDEFSRKIDDNLTEVQIREAVRRSRSQAQTFADSDYRDLYDFAQLLKVNIGYDPANTTDPLYDQKKAIYEAADKLMVSVAQAIIANDSFSHPTDINLDKARGLSIYFPDSLKTWLSTYQQYLVISYSNFWDDFIYHYLRVQGDTLPPAFTSNMPVVVECIKPSVDLLLSDADAGVDIKSLVVKLDDKELKVDKKFDPFKTLVRVHYGTDLPTVEPPYSPLPPGAHTVTLENFQDTAGNLLSPASFTFAIAPRVFSEGVSMFSLPYVKVRPQPHLNKFEPEYVTPNFLFGIPEDLLSGRIFWYDPTDQSWKDFSKSPLQPGRSYFVKLDSELPVRVDGDYVGQSYDATRQIWTDEYYIKNIKTGWNMIGNPFLFPVSWNAVRVKLSGQETEKSLEEAVALGWIKPTIYWYVPGGYQWATAPEGVLLRWQGYWVKALKDCQLIVPPLPSAERGVSENITARKDRSKSGGWRVQISAACGEEKDLYNYFGIEANCSDGYDSQDIPEPPACPGAGGISLRFSHPEWGKEGGWYAQDLRSTKGIEKSWDFEVETALPNRSVVLFWSNLSEVPRDWQLILHDLEAHKKIYMRTSSSYTYNSGSQGGVRRFRIEVCPKSSGGLLISNISTTPSRGTMAISFALSQSATVNLEIRSLSGKLIRKLWGGRILPAGLNQVIWDGTDSEGNRVPKGPYICYISAVTEEMRAQKAAKIITVLK